MTREEYESWLRVEKQVINKVILMSVRNDGWQVHIQFQVADLKRKLELEEMRKFRQMSRPSFKDSKKQDPSINEHEDPLTNYEDDDKWKHVPRSFQWRVIICLSFFCLAILFLVS